MNDYVLIIRIQDIHCVGCLNRIQHAVMNLDANHVEVDLSNHIGKIYFHGDSTRSADFCKAILDAGYHAEQLALIPQSEFGV
ncbi:MAG: heavy-metal-associated domain-containing protein [Firmicutes bacterium]|nr:heavy-metal-associated domain-containing protein [Bacillota bacterium]